MLARNVCILSIVIVCVISVMVQAESIPLLKNVTTGQTVFSDDWEGQVVGVNPGAPWTGGNYGGTLSSVLVTADFASEGVAAYQGQKFVKLQRPDDYGGVFLQGNGSNSDTGDTIRLEIAFQINGVQSSLYLTNGIGGNPITQLGFWGNGDISVITPDNQNWDILTQKANVGEWNTLVVEHVNGVDAWLISVNGAAFESCQGLTGKSTLAFDGITMQTDSRNSTAYWDAVPEPATMCLMAVGGLAVLKRRTR